MKIPGFRPTPPTSTETMNPNFEDRVEPQLSIDTTRFTQSQPPRASFADTFKYAVRNIFNSSPLSNLLGKEKITFVGPDGIEYKAREGLTGKLTIKPRNNPGSTPQNALNYKAGQETAALLQKQLRMDGKKGVPVFLNSTYTINNPELGEAIEVPLNGLDIKRPDGSRTIATFADPSQAKSGVQGTNIVRTRPLDAGADVAALENAATSARYIYGQHREQIDAEGLAYRVMNGRAYVRDTKDPNASYEPMPGMPDIDLKKDGIKVGQFVDAEGVTQTGVYALSQDGQRIMGLSQNNHLVDIQLPAPVNSYSIRTQGGALRVAGLVQNPADPNGASHILLNVAQNPDTGRFAFSYQDLSQDNPAMTRVQPGFDPNVPASRRYKDLAFNIDAQHGAAIPRLLLVDVDGGVKSGLQQGTRDTGGTRLELTPVDLQGSHDTQIKRLDVVHERGQPALYARGVGSDPLRDLNSPTNNTSANTDHQLLYRAAPNGLAHVPLDVNNALFMQKNEGLPQPQPKILATGNLITDPQGNQTYQDPTADIWLKNAGEELWTRHDPTQPVAPQDTTGKMLRFNDDGARVMIADDPNGGAQGRVWVKRSYLDKEWTPTELTGYDKLMSDNSNYANQFDVLFGKKANGELYRLDLEGLTSRAVTSTAGDKVAPTQYELKPRETRLISHDPVPAGPTEKSAAIPNAREFAVATAMQKIAAVDANGQVHVANIGQPAQAITLPPDLNGAQITQVAFDKGNNLFAFAPEHNGIPARVFLHRPSADGARQWVTHNTPGATKMTTPGTYGDVIVEGRNPAGEPLKAQLLIKEQPNGQPRVYNAKPLPPDVMENIQRNLARTLANGELTANLNMMGQTTSAPVNSLKNFGKNLKDKTLNIHHAFWESVMAMPNASKFAHEQAQQRKNGYSNLDALYQQTQEANTTLNTRFADQNGHPLRNTYIPSDTQLINQPQLHQQILQEKESLEKRVLTGIDTLLKHDEQLTKLDKNRHHSYLMNGRVSTQLKRDPNAPNLAQDLRGEMQRMINHENRTRVESLIDELPNGHAGRQQISNFLASTPDNQFSRKEMIRLRDIQPKNSTIHQALDTLLTQPPSIRQQEIEKRMALLEHKHWPLVDTKMRRDIKHLPITLGSISKDLERLDTVNGLLERRPEQNKTNILQQIQQQPQSPNALLDQSRIFGADIAHVEGINNHLQILNAAYNNPKWGDEALKKFTGLKEIEPIYREDLWKKIYQSLDPGGRTALRVKMQNEISGGVIGNVPLLPGVLNLRAMLGYTNVDLAESNQSHSNHNEMLSKPATRAAAFSQDGYKLTGRVGLGTGINFPGGANLTGFVDPMNLEFTNLSGNGAVSWRDNNATNKATQIVLKNTPITLNDIFDFFALQGERGLVFTRKTQEFEEKIKGGVGFGYNPKEWFADGGAGVGLQLGLGEKHTSSNNKFTHTNKSYDGQEAQHRSVQTSELEGGVYQLFSLGKQNAGTRYIQAPSNLFMGIQLKHQKTLGDWRCEAYFQKTKPLSENEWQSFVSKVSDKFFQSTPTQVAQWQQLFRKTHPNEPNHVGNREFLNAAQEIIHLAKETDIYQKNKDLTAIDVIDKFELRLGDHQAALQGKFGFSGHAYQQVSSRSDLLKIPQIKAMYEQSGEVRQNIDASKQADTNGFVVRWHLTKTGEQKMQRILSGEEKLDSAPRLEVLNALKNKMPATHFQRIDRLLTREMGDDQVKEISSIMQENNIRPNIQTSIIEKIDPKQRVYELMSNPKHGFLIPAYLYANHTENYSKENSLPLGLVRFKQAFDTNIRFNNETTTLKTNNQEQLVKSTTRHPHASTDNPTTQKLAHMTETSIQRQLPPEQRYFEHTEQKTPLPSPSNMMHQETNPIADHSSQTSGHQKPQSNFERVLMQQTPLQRAHEQIDQVSAEISQKFPAALSRQNSASIAKPKTPPVSTEITAETTGASTSGAGSSKPVVGKHTVRLQAEREGQVYHSTSQAKSNVTSTHPEGQSSTTHQPEKPSKKSSWLPSFASALKPSGSPQKTADHKADASEKGDPSAAKRGVLAGMWQQVRNKKESAVKNATGDNPSIATPVLQNPTITPQVDHILGTKRSIEEAARHNPLDIIKGGSHTPDGQGTSPHISKGRGH